MTGSAVLVSMTSRKRVRPWPAAKIALPTESGTQLSVKKLMTGGGGIYAAVDESSSYLSAAATSCSVKSGYSAMIRSTE